MMERFLVAAAMGDRRGRLQPVQRSSYISHSKAQLAWRQPLEQSTLQHAPVCKVLAAQRLAVFPQFILLSSMS